MKEIYQLWQVWCDNGNEFLMGTYVSKKRAEKEVNKIKKEKYLPVEYFIRKERVVE